MTLDMAFVSCQRSAVRYALHTMQQDSQRRTFFADHFYTEPSRKNSDVILLWHFTILGVFGHGRVEGVVAVGVGPVATITNVTTNGRTDCLARTPVVSRIMDMLAHNSTNLCEHQPFPLEES